MASKMTETVRINDKMKNSMLDELKCGQCKDKFTMPVLLDPCGHRVCKSHTNEKNRNCPLSNCGKAIQKVIEDPLFKELADLAENTYTCIKKLDERKDYSVLEKKLQKIAPSILKIHEDYAKEIEAYKIDKEKRTNSETELKKLNDSYQQLNDKFCQNYNCYLERNNLVLFASPIKIRVKLLLFPNEPKKEIQIEDFELKPNDKFDDLISKLNGLKNLKENNLPNINKTKIFTFCFGPATKYNASEANSIYDKFKNTGVVYGDVSIIEINSESLFADYSIKENSEIAIFLKD